MIHVAFVTDPVTKTTGSWETRYPHRRLPGTGGIRWAQWRIRSADGADRQDREGPGDAAASAG
jgi:hypothetical protein